MTPSVLTVQGEAEGYQKGARMLEILGKTNIDFMGKRMFAFILSGIMVLLGLIALVQSAREELPIWGSTLPEGLRFN